MLRRQGQRSVLPRIGGTVATVAWPLAAGLILTTSPIDSLHTLQVLTTLCSKLTTFLPTINTQLSADHNLVLWDQNKSSTKYVISAIPVSLCSPQDIAQRSHAEQGLNKPVRQNTKPQNTAFLIHAYQLFLALLVITYYIYYFTIRHCFCSSRAADMFFSKQACRRWWFSVHCLFSQQVTPCQSFFLHKILFGQGYYLQRKPSVTQTCFWIHPLLLRARLLMKC